MHGFGVKMIRIKICGITNSEDAQLSCELGADALGFVFFSGSPRYINLSAAQNIIQALPPFVTTVGLFVNPTESDVWNAIENVSLDVLQFHGDESVEFCRLFDKPYIKAIRVQNQEDIMRAETEYAGARALLLDAHVDGLFGGTGQSFDWRLLPETLTIPWVLSGGLNPNNVVEAIKATKAIAVDVSSGVEQEKGVKCAAKLAAFIQGVKSGSVFISK